MAASQKSSHDSLLWLLLPSFLLSFFPSFLLVLVLIFSSFFFVMHAYICTWCCWAHDKFYYYWVVPVGLLTPLTLHRLCPLGVFIFPVHIFFAMEGDNSEFMNFTEPTLAFLKEPMSECVWQWARTCCSCYRMPKTLLSPCTHNLSLSQEMIAKTLFFILHHLSPVFLANATVVAFVLLCNSRFTFHCYTQGEPMPTQKSAQKWQLQPFRLLVWNIIKGILLSKAASLNCPILRAKKESMKQEEAT